MPLRQLRVISYGLLFLLLPSCAPGAGAVGVARVAGNPDSGGGAASQSSATSAPTSAAYSLKDVEDLVRGGMRTVRILELARRDCISFAMDAAATARLDAVGADADLISGLRGVCRVNGSGAR